MLPGVQAVEIGYAIDAEKDRLAIDDELGLPVPERGLDDQRVAFRPIVAVASEQPDAGAVADDD